MENVQIVEKVLELVVLLCACIIGRFVIPAIKGKIGEQKLAEITMWVHTFVKYAEQIFAPGTGEEKLAVVTTHVSDKACELGLTLSSDEIRALIEEAVFVINKEAKESDK